MILGSGFSIANVNRFFLDSSRTAECSRPTCSEHFTLQCMDFQIGVLDPITPGDAHDVIVAMHSRCIVARSYLLLSLMISLIGCIRMSDANRQVIVTTTLLEAGHSLECITHAGHSIAFGVFCTL